MPDRKWTDETTERWVGNLLRAGVTMAAVVILAGGVLFLIRYGARVADHRTFHGEPENLRSPADIVTGALTLHSRSMIQLGILLLVATPVARVAFSALAFARQRDWVYVAITLLVLGLLLFSLFHGELAAPS